MLVLLWSHNFAGCIFCCEQQQPQQVSSKDGARDETEKPNMDTFEDEMTVVNDKDVLNETRRSTELLRGTVNRGVAIPAVSTRPPISAAPRRQSMFGSNVLDETTAKLVCARVLLSRDKSKMPDMRFAPDALRLLSFGIQQHLANIIDISSANGRKRSNRTACEHFQKTQKLISMQTADSAAGEVASENRKNLGMMWGPDNAEAARKDGIERARLFFENYSAEEESLKAELQQLDEERKSSGRRKKDGSDSAAEAAATAPKEWWLKEVHIVALVLHFRANLIIVLGGRQADGCVVVGRVGSGTYEAKSGSQVPLGQVHAH